MKTRRVLCLSGGGCRGISQLIVLKKLEEEFGKPLCEVYDLIAGTSVGAINAALIASGKISMADLLGIYPEVLKKVFTKKWYRLKKPKYQRKYFREEWDKIVGKDFMMSDSKTRLMLTSVDLVKDENHFFKSWYDDMKNERMVDMVCRSFAAPMYFGHIVDNKNKKCWSDGGVGNANLPLNEVKTQVESFQWYDKCSIFGGNDVHIDAIGCLYYDPHHTFEKIKKNRWIKQIFDYLNLGNGGLARAQSRNDQIRMMSYLTKDNHNIQFRYWDREIPKKIDKLDGVKYLNEYKKYGIEMAKKPMLDLTR